MGVDEAAPPREQGDDASSPLSYEEIGERLGLHKGTVQAIAKRALAKLRKRLRENNRV